MSKAAKNMEAIVIENPRNLRGTTMRVDALSKMSRLEMLDLGLSDHDLDVNFSGRLDNLSNELVYLWWNQYPFESLPQNFEPDKLVELMMSNSNIKQLWEGKRYINYYSF